MSNPLLQYTRLFREQREIIEKHSASVLNAPRGEALSMLESMHLPNKGEENYEVFDLPGALAPDYGLNLTRMPLNVNLAESFKCGVSRLSASFFVMVNDSLAANPTVAENLPSGVEVASLAKAASKMPEAVADYYNRIADNSNPLVALSTLLAQDGLWIRIARNTKVDNPIQIVDILGGAPNLMSVKRVVIVMEEGAEAKLLFCGHNAKTDTPLLSLQTVEVYAGDNSNLEIVDLEETDGKLTRLSTLWLRQGADCNVLINGMTISNGKTRNEYHCEFRAPGSELKLYGMGIADGNRVIDTYSRVAHDCGHCKTDELFKYSVDDEARCAFTGLVRVAHGADKTEAYQSNRNIVGSDLARMYSKPQLEIYNDDVKCSHGSAIGRFDEMQIFYMRSRGIDEATARLLLKQAFMADVIDKVHIDGLHERLQLIVEHRFAGLAAGCKNCNLSSPNGL